MKIAIRTILIIALITNIAYGVIHIEDAQMNYKNWVSLILFPILFQLLVGGYIEKIHDE